MLALARNRFLFDVHNISSFAIPGVAVAPATNAFGSWVEILSDTVVTQDCYFIVVNISNVAVLGQAKDFLVDIGSDPAGGTSWGVIIPNLLGTGAAATGSAGHGVTYRFPLFIKAGTALAARASVNNGTPGSSRIMVRLYGQPTRPEMMRRGLYVTSFGEVPASSRGTTVTPGSSGAEGAAWVQLGSNTTREHWWWQMGLGCSDNDTQSSAFLADLAAGSGVSANDVIVKDEWWAVNTSEAWNKPNWGPDEAYVADVPVGSGIFGRASQSVVPDAGVSMMAYGLGG